MSIVNILMTGGGAPGAAGILKCFQQEPSFCITAADADSNAVGKYLAENFVPIPLANDPSFINAITEICHKRNIQVILPLVTKELIPLAANKDNLEKEGIKVAISSAASLEIANNKGRLYEFLQWRGIAVPDFRIAETTEQFIEAAAALGHPSKTICFKPTVSNGSRGFRIISDKVDELDLLFNHKPSSAYMSYTDAVRIISSGKFPELLISEYLPGEEYSVDCLADHGKTVLAVPRLRTKIINGITVAGIIEQEESIIQYCTSIIHELQLHGSIGIQVKKSATGQYLVLEINPRVQGTISAILGAGVNIPVLAVKQELGHPISENELKVKWGTKFARYWEDVFY